MLSWQMSILPMPDELNTMVEAVRGKRRFFRGGFNERMKSQASLQYNGVVNVNINLKGISYGNVLYWSRRTQ
jgi:hypothetical protein